MKQPGIPVVKGSQVEKLCKVAEVRRILMSMKAALPEKQGGCVAVTSTNPEEGKTILSLLLASAVADCEGKKVLAVDLNWRNPGLHRAFEVERSFDLNSFLDGNNPEEHIQRTMFSRAGCAGRPQQEPAGRPAQPFFPGPFSSGKDTGPL